MSRASVIARGRAFSEAGFKDTFTVWRRTGAKITDPDTFVEVDEYAAIHTGINGKFQATASLNIASQTPGMTVAETLSEWHTSVGVLDVRTDDEIECTAVDPEAGDPAQVGVRVRITGPFTKSYATARRFQVEELS